MYCGAARAIQKHFAIKRLEQPVYPYYIQALNAPMNGNFGKHFTRPSARSQHLLIPLDIAPSDGFRVKTFVNPTSIVG